MRGEDMRYPVRIFIKLIINIEHLTAGVTENGVTTLVNQRFYNYLCAGKFHYISPFESLF